MTIYEHISGGISKQYSALYVHIFIERSQILV